MSVWFSLVKEAWKASMELVAEAFEEKAGKFVRQGDHYFRGEGVYRVQGRPRFL